MDNKHLSLIMVLLLASVFAIFSLSSASAQSSDCWQYTSNATGQCTSDNGCTWKSDDWGSWCEELNCWSLNSQSDCSTTVVPGKNCSWQGGGTSYYCSEPSCMGYSGTNADSCENNTAGRSCSWNAQCYSSGGAGGVDCWSITDSSTCTNSTGCNWGDCMDRGCWDYSTSNTCTAAKDPWNGRNCTWDSSASSCMDDSCWSGSLYPNQTACDSSTYCTWMGSATTGRCEEINCGYFDGNQTGCTNANTTQGIDCTWNTGFCMEDNCWSYDSNEAGCNAKAGCEWTAWESSGWCEEINCWTWDGMHGGSESACNGNDTLYGLNCNWVNQSGGTGWCEQDFSSTNCTSFTNERQCYDSWYCWWQANDWSDPSAGGNCTDPDWSSIPDSGSILNDWNPGCYIFDYNQTECGYIIGCDNSTANACNTASGHANENEINTNGINCTMINDSSMCNSIPALSSCCSWQNGSCTTNAFDASCWNDLAQTQGGETSCEDATSQSNCNALAGSPWFWPCKWDNATSPAKCSVKADDIWGNNTMSYVSIENQKICESIGGKWITENYCAGDVSIPTGRCEYKFDDETNCNKACFACEYKSDGTAHNDSSDAKIACEASNLGYCEFSEDSSAPNGFGTCKAKPEFVSGVSDGCSESNCAGCTFMGVGNSSQAGNGTRTSEQWCNDFPTSCKWVSDSVATTGGYCVDIDTKTCDESCDRCETQDTCTNDGRSKLTNVSGSCKWQGGDDGDCVANIAGDVEVCWNGEDDDADGLIDCADPGCYADSFCGMVEGDCFVWQNSGDCASDSDCEWITDKWGSWCDFKGSQCWRNDGSANTCKGITDTNETLDISVARLAGNNINESYTFQLTNLGYGWVGGTIVITNETGTSLAGNYTVDYSAQTINFTNNSFMVSGGGMNNITNVSYQYNDTSGEYCEWQAGSGNGWCEQDWSVAEDCFLGTNESYCNSITASDGQTCVWENDTWCDSQAEGNDWCDNNGGWCDHPDFVPQDCWQYYDNSTCSGASSCNWKVDEWSNPHCDVNWSVSCWDVFDSATCGNTAGCNWRSESWGGWCEDSMSSCWGYTSESTCSTATQECTWESYGGGGGNCQPSCFNSTLLDSSSACGATSGCVWLEETGWCEEQQAQSCFNSTNSNNQNNCDATDGCRWRNDGWCNPADGFSTGGTAGGGGGGGATGGECYKYDGNQTQCVNKTVTGTACSWSSEENPWCEVDWSTDCWSYSDPASGCNSTNGCWFKNDSFGGSYCTNLMDQCWSNTTLQGDLTACNTNAYCNSTTWGTCEPTCFSATDEATCGTGCKWLTGWCNSAGMMDMFDDMESGAPVPLGMDDCQESGMQASVDICGFGMKDMGDTYGFGSNVASFENSSVCNKVKISSFVMDMEGGGGGGFGGPSASEKTGDGNETVKYLVYLDTDGSTTGNCKVESNTSSDGYEFKLRYASEWNANTSKATESFTSYKCDNNKWVASDIKTSTWKQKMCGEIGGPMIAVEKGELSRFPTLYSSTADLRVFVATIGNTGNITTPTDSAGPGWATPGAIDFEIGGAMEWGANSAKFEDIMQKGFVTYEDCYNGADDDNDGSVDCSDWDCEFSSACTNSGVNAAGFSDTTMPTMKGMRLEEYPDAAKIMFETSKPVNGTLNFYGTDSTCKIKNASINDIGIRSTNVRTYKMWQEIDIYNDGGTDSLGYDLTNDTTYYYKLNFCDTNNRCAISKCSSFVTSNTNSCGFCDFVLRLKEPSGWTVSYDADQDGTYEHTQGAVCGANAGMKMNYTDGRAINIKMAKDDGSVYFEFINSTISKTGLNDKVRTLTTDDDSIIGTSTLVGLNSETRDKLINNLHPEVCRLKIPFSGTCDTLYHCDDSGSNCVDKTSEATLVDATNCVWDVPYCEFSTYKEYTVSSGDSGGGSSGGGGGGGSATNGTANESEGGGPQLSPPGSASGGTVTGRASDEGKTNKPTGRTSGGASNTAMLWIIGATIVVALVGILIGVIRPFIKRRRGY